MGFLRVVEVFPPLFPSRPGGASYDVDGGVERFVDEARRVSDVADIVLVADVKNPKFLRFTTLQAALLLRERLGVDAAPVIVLRDINRPAFLSSVLTGLSLGLKSMMIAWGDNYPSGARNVRDFPSLAGALRQASDIRDRVRSSALFLAPVDVERLANPEGVALAKGRLRAGADYLLAQPPTSDSREADRHMELLDKAGLRNRVLLNMFPFRDSKDVKGCERFFGWHLPRSLHLTAARGPTALFEAEKDAVIRMREAKLPGVYLNTRGDPGVPSRLLG